MCRREYIGIRPHPQKYRPTTGIRGQSVSSLTSINVSNVLCSVRLKNFSAKGMTYVTSYRDSAYRMVS